MLLDFATSSFRWGLEHLSESEPAWLEVKEILRSITREKINAKKRESFLQWREGKRKSPAVGGQEIINKLIDDEFVRFGWESQVYVLDITKQEISNLAVEESVSSKVSNSESDEESSEKIAYWTMDFKKDYIGIEVSFNNAGVLAQNLLRLSVMSESHLKTKEERIRLGILITATDSLKRWSNMDDTVLTFEAVNRIFPLINFNIPTPIVVIGLNNSSEGQEWSETNYFGHKKLSRYSDLDSVQRAKWDAIINS